MGKRKKETDTEEKIKKRTNSTIGQSFFHIHWQCNIHYRHWVNLGDQQWLKWEYFPFESYFSKINLISLNAHKMTQFLSAKKWRRIEWPISKKLSIDLDLACWLDILSLYMPHGINLLVRTEATSIPPPFFLLYTVNYKQHQNTEKSLSLLRR